MGEDGSIKVFHANSIESLKKDYDGVFKEGRFLISLRNIDLVILLDWESEEVVWKSEVDLDRQHNPTMTEAGNVLIFDNGWETRDYTRVIEVSSDNNIVWEYTKDNFYSQYMGSAQELPNGNILISSASQDWAFEVDKETKNIVWNFNVSSRDSGVVGPFENIKNNHGGLFRLTRYNTSCIKEVFNGTVKHSRLCK